ncbi:MAG: HD domain-containing protein [Anaerolineales bacterium]|jgi:tRNA nucleotidyltransferase/poly(A) polymerase
MSLASLFSTPLFETLADLSEDRKIWLVGGALRDHFMGRTAIDLDFAVEQDARKLARRYADVIGGKYFDLDRERDTGRVILLQHDGGRRVIDFARLRGRNIQSDLLDRDFTINALAVPLGSPDELIDPTEGLQDLRDGILRSCHPNAFQRDPVRVLRVVRIAMQFHFRIEAKTLQQARHALEGLAQISSERIRDELMRMLALQRPARALRVLDHMGGLKFILPELDALKGIQQPASHDYDAWEHSLAVVDRLSHLLSVLVDDPDPDESGNLVLAQASGALGRFRDALRKHLDIELSVGRSAKQLLILAALYHDVGKGAMRGIGIQEEAAFHGHENRGAEMIMARAEALHLSRVEIERLGLIVQHHMRLEWLERENLITARAVYRFYRQAREAGVDSILVSLADCLGKFASGVPEDIWKMRVETARILLSAFLENRNQDVDPEPLLRGSDLITELELNPGPRVGYLLEAIREAQACKEINTYDEAIDLARELIKGEENQQSGR